MYNGNFIYNQTNPHYESKINNRYVKISIPNKINSNSPHIFNSYFSSEEENFNLTPNYILTDNTRYTSKNNSKNSTNRYGIINQVLNENTISYSNSQYNKYGNNLYPEKRERNRILSKQNEEFSSKRKNIYYVKKDSNLDKLNAIYNDNNYGKVNIIKIKNKFPKHISPLSNYHNNYNKISNYDFGNNNNINNSPYDTQLTKHKSHNIFNHDKPNYKYNNILYKEYNAKKEYREKSLLNSYYKEIDYDSKTLKSGNNIIVNDENGSYNNKLISQRNHANVITIDNANGNKNIINGKSSNNFVDVKNYKKINNNFLKTKDITPYDQKKNINNFYNIGNKSAKRIDQKEKKIIINTENNNKEINSGIPLNNRVYDSKIDRNIYLSSNIMNTDKNSSLNKNYSLRIIKYSSNDLQKTKNMNHKSNIVNNYNNNILKKSIEKNEKKNNSIREVNLNKLNSSIKNDKKIYIIEKKINKDKDEIKNNSILSNRENLHIKNENNDYINKGRYHKNNIINFNEAEYKVKKDKIQLGMNDKNNKLIKDNIKVNNNFINEGSKPRINLRKNSSMLLNSKKYNKNRIEKIKIDCFSYIPFSKEKKLSIKKLKKSKKKYSKLNTIQLFNIQEKIYDEDFPIKLKKNKGKVLKPQISLRLSLFGIKKPERNKYYIVNLFYSENLRNKIDAIESDF